MHTSDTGKFEPIETIRSLNSIDRRKAATAFTLIELLVVIAIIAIIAAILFPVFAQARASARATTCVSNVKQVALGVLMYAEDYDENIPLIDNNGSTYYGCPNNCVGGGCYPDWGTPGVDPNEPNAMFFGVVQPYIKNRKIAYCPEAGTPNWASVIPQSWAAGVPYVAALDAKGIYQDSFSQMAVNELLTEFGPGGDWSGCASGAGYKSSGTNLAAWTRPAELYLLTGDSVWGFGAPSSYFGSADQSPQNAVGNTATWPTYDNQSASCYDWGGFPINVAAGYTWYVHRAVSRIGVDYNAANTTFNNGISSGLANIAFADGHVKPMRQPVLEQCAYNTQANVWTYPYWDYRY
jgi:prepilin-type N-terminal cleavage/methylation domain-containing protein/prepilin-type processing-associated H-X9-DG protein